MEISVVRNFIPFIYNTLTEEEHMVIFFSSAS